jgi:two-component system copper resistance phosphate regulon response regulator CusR
MSVALQLSHSCSITYSEAMASSGSPGLFPKSVFIFRSRTIHSTDGKWTVAGGYKMRILLIEDEHKLSNFLQRELVAEGYATDVASDGRRGLELAISCRYDLILLDLMLPQMDGIEVLRQIRAKGLPVPVLILSARRTLQDKIVAKESGADDYLTKPLDFSDLLARIKVLTQHDLNAASTIRVSDLELERSSRQARRAGRLIELTSKEYALLELLMSHAGRVISRKMIIEQVWDDSFDCISNIVDVCISQLRNKVDAGHEPRLVHTVRGLGYTICEGKDELASTQQPSRRPSSRSSDIGSDHRFR